jgi:hypothetical protein
MNDEQIRDSMRQLTASAPQTDIWPRISEQVVGQKPRRPLLPPIHRHPLLVGLNVMAIIVLLVLVISPLTTSQQAEHPGTVAQIATTSGAGNSSASQQANSSPTISSQVNPHTYNLAELTRLMNGNPNFRLPTYLPANYSLESTEMYRVTYDETGKQTGEDCCWRVNYQQYIPGQDNTNFIRFNASSHVRVIKAGDQQVKGVTVADPLMAVGDPQYGTFGGSTLSDDTRLTARYRRTDRVIEIYHDARLDPTLREYAYVFFATGDRSYPLTRCTIIAPYNVTDSEMLKIADSIERVDPNHLERYQ